MTYRWCHSCDRRFTEVQRPSRNGISSSATVCNWPGAAFGIVARKQPFSYPAEFSTGGFRASGRTAAVGQERPFIHPAVLSFEWPRYSESCPKTYACLSAFALVHYCAFINDGLFGLYYYFGDCIVLRMLKERRKRFSNRDRFCVSHSQTTMTFHPSKRNCF